METESCPRCEAPSDPPIAPAGPGTLRVAFLGNPNTGKTTLFNRLCGLRHKTSNFPGTTQEARLGTVKFEAAAPAGRNGNGAARPRELHIIDLPGIYSIALAQNEAEVCRGVLAGEIALAGEVRATPDAMCIVVDAANLPRNLTFVGEMLGQRLPMVVVLNMIDLARRAGTSPDRAALEEALGCPVIACSARSGEGIEALLDAVARARVPNRTPPGDRAALEQWADALASRCTRHTTPGSDGRFRPSALTDRLDHLFTHPVLGPLVFASVMACLFFVLFKIASIPMELVDHVFGFLSGLIESVMPAGILRDLISQGVVGGVGATVIFLPQICLLFFLISLLEDTGYLARAAFLMDRLLRPFGLPGHAFVPLLSSHACALPGIMATRAIPDRRERLATILVTPFMTCSARIPVYVLAISVLFRERPFMAGLAFVGCYALGSAASLFSALVIRRTILRGKGRPMVMELPTYKVPSIRTALLTTYDRATMFLKNAGTNILAICIVLWWLGAFPHVNPPARAVELREQATTAALPIMPPGARDGEPLSREQLTQLLAEAKSRYASETASTPGKESPQAHASRLAGETYEAALLPEEDRLARVKEWSDEADRLERSHAKAESYAGRLGRFVQPVFAPLGFDWQLTVGVVTSFAAREVFVSTMAIIVAGTEDKDDPGVVDAIRDAKRADGVTPVFTTATAWSLLVFYVLAMQCLPTLAVTAREAGGIRWALLQLVWMSGLAYIAAFGAYRLVLFLNH